MSSTLEPQAAAILRLLAMTKYHECNEILELLKSDFAHGGTLHAFLVLLQSRRDRLAQECREL